jgi:hypothetical protein
MVEKEATLHADVFAAVATGSAEWDVRRIDVADRARVEFRHAGRAEDDGFAERDEIGDVRAREGARRPAAIFLIRETALIGPGNEMQSWHQCAALRSRTSLTSATRRLSVVPE